MAKKAASAYAEKDAEIMGVVDKYCRMRNVQRTKRCNLIGCSRSTWNAREKDVGSMSLSEIRRVQRYLKIPREELIELFL